MSNIKRKIGIMGGTFDPIHTGHLVTAEVVRIEYNLEKVLFIPAANPPHKQNSQVTPSIHRYNMAVMATDSNSYFEVSPIELERPGLSYTIDTVLALIEKYGKNTDFYFITGADAVLELPTWKNIDQLLDMCYFIAATRPGCVCNIDDIIKKFGVKGRQRIQRLPTPKLEISSTDIRERVRRGRSIKYIVPDCVECYILKEGLYSN